MDILKGFAAAGNRLTGPSPVVPSGNVATVGLHFLLSSEWDELEARLIIHKGGLTYQQTIGEDGTVAIPGGAMETSGSFDLGLAGYVMEGDDLVMRLSTNRISGRVIDGAYVAGMTPAPGHDDPSDWERMLDHLVDYLNPHRTTAEQVGAYDKTEADNLLASKLSRTGGTMTGAINMGGKKITNLGAPTSPSDAATKQYVDEHKIDIDSELSRTSTNPVENKVIADALDEKLDANKSGILGGNLRIIGSLNVFGMGAYSITVDPQTGKIAGLQRISLGTELQGIDLNVDTKIMEFIGSPGVIRGLNIPVRGDEAANKAYVDATITQLENGDLKIRFDDDAFALVTPKTVNINRSYNGYLINGVAGSNVSVTSGMLIPHNDLDAYGFTYFTLNARRADRALDTGTVQANWQNYKRLIEANLNVGTNKQLCRNTAVFTGATISGFNATSTTFDGTSMVVTGAYTGLALSFPTGITERGTYHVAFEIYNATAGTGQLRYNVNTGSSEGAKYIMALTQSYQPVDIAISVPTEYAGVNSIYFFQTEPGVKTLHIRNLRIYMD